MSLGLQASFYCYTLSLKDRGSAFRTNREAQGTRGTPPKVDGAERCRENEGMNFKQGKMTGAQTQAGTDGFCHRNSPKRLEEPVKDKSSFQIQAGLYPEGRVVSWSGTCKILPENI